MKLLIIEDEAAAAHHLRALIQQRSADIQILAVLETVRASTIWLQQHPSPDLILSDIQLADGTCFELFKTIKVTAPIIFITAYDEYMQQAFKMHSIDYLLKPVDEQELNTALDKYLQLKHQFQQNLQDRLWQVLNDYPKPGGSYKSRFLIKTGDNLSTIPVEQVAFLRADDRIVWLHDNQHRKYIIDESLDNLEKVLDPRLFFRINRRYITGIAAIDKIQHHFNGKLLIRLKTWDDPEIFISREKARLFKTWLDGGCV